MKNKSKIILICLGVVLLVMVADLIQDWFFIRAVLQAYGVPAKSLDFGELFVKVLPVLLPILIIGTGIAVFILWKSRKQFEDKIHSYQSREQNSHNEDTK